MEGQNRSSIQTDDLVQRFKELVTEFDERVKEHEQKISKKLVNEKRKFEQERREFEAEKDLFHQNINEQQNLLEEEKNQWLSQLEYIQEREKIVEENLRKIKHKIKVNVGGSSFTTSKSTLCMRGGYFEAMLGSGQWKPDEDGEYFIDRNPALFSEVLEFLRTGKLLLENFSDVKLERLQDEFAYYQIEFPGVGKKEEDIILQWDTLQSDKAFQISHHDKRLSRASDGCQPVAYSAYKFTRDGTSIYRIKFHYTGNKSVLGLSPASQRPTPGVSLLSTDVPQLVAFEISGSGKLEINFRLNKLFLDDMNSRELAPDVGEWLLCFGTGNHHLTMTILSCTKSYY